MSIPNLPLSMGSSFCSVEAGLGAELEEELEPLFRESAAFFRKFILAEVFLET